MAGQITTRRAVRTSSDNIDAWSVQFNDPVVPMYRIAGGPRTARVLTNGGVDLKTIAVPTKWDDMKAVKRIARPDACKDVMPEWLADLIPKHDDLGPHSEVPMMRSSR
ncbi:MAG: hypothetical protein AAGA26_07580 [Pseudomonadota bacterium]